MRVVHIRYTADDCAVVQYYSWSMANPQLQQGLFLYWGLGITSPAALTRLAIAEVERAIGCDNSHSYDEAVVHYDAALRLLNEALICMPQLPASSVTFLLLFYGRVSGRKKEQKDHFSCGICERVLAHLPRFSCCDH